MKSEIQLINTMEGGLLLLSISIHVFIIINIIINVIVIVVIVVVAVVVDSVGYLVGYRMNGWCFAFQFNMKTTEFASGAISHFQ